MEKRDEINVDKEVADYMEKHGDFRVCTSCTGPCLVPLEFAEIKTKENSSIPDILVMVGRRRLYVSGTQYRRGLRRISQEMLGRKACGIGSAARS